MYALASDVLEDVAGALGYNIGKSIPR